MYGFVQNDFHREPCALYKYIFRYCTAASTTYATQL